MYKIGELSKLCKIPVKTLRFYDNIGLLKADRIDEYSGYRYYKASRLSDCYRILALKELGFSLDEIRGQMELTKEELNRLILAKKQELTALRTETERRIKLLEQINAGMKEEGAMFSIVVRKSDEIRTAYTRRILVDREEADGILCEMKQNLPEDLSGKRCVIIDYETEYRPESADMGLCVEINGQLPKQCAYQEKLIHFEEDTASLICRREQVEKATLALHQYIQENNLQIIGASYQVIYEDGTVEMKIPVCRLQKESAVPNNDSLDVIFENDEQVIGRWELIDYLPSKEQFHPDKLKSVITNERIDKLCFLPGGEWYWCFGWTKGYLLSRFGYPSQQGKNAYTIEKIKNETYLFVEMKFHDYYMRGGRPEVWVFRQLDNLPHTKEEIQFCDDISISIADDDKVIGVWESCDLLRDPKDFNPECPNPNFPPDALYWMKAEFMPEGKMKNSFRDGSISESPVWRWATGNVICMPRKTASMYRFKKVKDTEYLFIQWKSGDYTYGGEAPWWYVFRKEKRT